MRPHESEERIPLSCVLGVPCMRTKRLRASTVTTANPVPQNQSKFISAGPLLRTLHCDARALRAPIGLLLRLRCLHEKAKLRRDIDFESLEL